METIVVNKKEWITLRNILMDQPARYVLNALTVMQLIETKEKLEKKAAEEAILKANTREFIPLEGDMMGNAATVTNDEPF